MQSSRTTPARRPQSATTAPNELAGHPVDRHVGQQLRIRRVYSGLSQTELGNKIGLSYQQVQKYESGRNRISASMLHDIAKELDVPITCFFEGLEQSGLIRLGRRMPALIRRSLSSRLQKEGVSSSTSSGCRGLSERGFFPLSSCSLKFPARKAMLPDGTGSLSYLAQPAEA